MAAPLGQSYPVGPRDHRDPEPHGRSSRRPADSLPLGAWEGGGVAAVRSRPCWAAGWEGVEPKGGAGGGSPGEGRREAPGPEAEGEGGRLGSSLTEQPRLQGGEEGLRGFQVRPCWPSKQRWGTPSGGSPSRGMPRLWMPAWPTPVPKSPISWRLVGQRPGSRAPPARGGGSRRSVGPRLRPPSCVRDILGATPSDAAQEIPPVNQGPAFPAPR